MQLTLFTHEGDSWSGRGCHQSLELHTLSRYQQTQLEKPFVFSFIYHTRKENCGARERNVAWSLELLFDLFTCGYLTLQLNLTVRGGACPHVLVNKVSKLRHPASNQEDKFFSFQWFTYLPDKAWNIDGFIFSFSLQPAAGWNSHLGPKLSQWQKRNGKKQKQYLTHTLLPSSWVNKDLRAPRAINYDQSKHFHMKESCDINR